MLDATQNLNLTFDIVTPLYITEAALLVGLDGHLSISSKCVHYFVVVLSRANRTTA